MVRPNGYTLHLTIRHRNEYLDRHWERGGVPTVGKYIRPTLGRFYEYAVDAETYEYLVTVGGSWHLEL